MLNLREIAPPDETVRQSRVMQSHYHRDMLGRFIKNRDLVAWSIGNQGYLLKVLQVVGSTTKRVKVYDHEKGKTKSVLPTNCIVITQQVQDNIRRNVAQSNEIDGDD
jgi:hypothetical protein